MNLHLFFHLMTVTEDIVEQVAGLLSQASTRLFPALELCTLASSVLVLFSTPDVGFLQSKSASHPSGLRLDSSATSAHGITRTNAISRCNVSF